MKRVFWVSLLALSSAAWASDHNDMEAGRPLHFDDAYSIAYRERAVEFGLSLETFHRSSSELGFATEFKYGFAKNQDFAIGFEPRWRGTGLVGDSGRVELSYFRGLRREIGNQPALGFRVDADLPTRRSQQGAEFRFRGIATKALGQYDKVHLNLDLLLPTHALPGERTHTFNAIVGYSSPLGYPRRFDQTLVAELALLQGSSRGQGYTGSLGVGLRQQVDARSVFDFGLASDIFAGKGLQRSQLRLALGYSVGF